MIWDDSCLENPHPAGESWRYSYSLYQEVKLQRRYVTNTPSAGLAPGVRQSDQTRRDGRIGGGGTDRHLRHYLIEASIWARKIPRYQATYERTRKRRGNKIARIVVARMLLRSIYKVLKDGVVFAPAIAAAPA